MCGGDVKMKKILISAIACIGLLGGAFGASACTSGEHEHVWNDGEVTTAATCNEEGEKTYTCTVKGCGETKTEKVNALGHAWNDGEITTEAKCDEFGVKTFTCTRCTATYTEPVDKTAHSYDGGELTVVPTLSTKGEIKYVCQSCGDEKVERVAARDDFSERFYTNIANATAWQYGSAQGYDPATSAFTFERIAATDAQQPSVWKAEGVEISRDKISSANNAAIAYTVTSDLELNAVVTFAGDEEATRVGAHLIIKDGTGAVKGEAVTLGGAEKDWSYTTQDSISVAAGDCVYIVFANEGLGAPSGKFTCRLTTSCSHIWNDGEETKPATCQENGEITYTCEECGETKVEQTAKANHSYTGAWTAVTGGHAKKCATCDNTDPDNIESHNLTEDLSRRVDATCHSDGEKTLVCDQCGAETTQEITVRPDHAFVGNWVGEEDGHHHVCQNAGCTQAEANRSHNWVDVAEVKPATNDEDGIMKIKCDVCQYESTRVIPAANHKQGDTLTYVDGGTTHWYPCTEHDDCGVKFEEEAHNFTTQLSFTDSTCEAPGQKVMQCECGATETQTVPVKDHSWDEGQETTAPTFWAEGVKTYTCSACGSTKEEPIAALETMGLSLNDSNWTFGTGMYDFGAGTYSFTEITNKTADAYKDGNGEIKEGWFANSTFDTCVIMKYTFEQDAEVGFNVTFAGIGGEDGIKSRYSIRVGLDDGKIDGKDYRDLGSAATENFAAKSYKAGDTVVFIFKHEGDGWDQGNYSITFNKPSATQTA